mmetsp:Transcript_25318/g.59250  ORF Transcript_25318/g.59250 Transcript_25318/m.59250 type:complete len:173 (+) Transcript_25318:775-1293(+)
MFERLSESDQRAFERASRQGFVTLEGTGYRRGRKSSALANLHREWCDKRSKPQIVLCKASGGRPLDNVIVDLSPLRLGILSPDGMDAAILKYKKQIIKAAEASGMVLRSDYIEDNSKKRSPSSRSRIRPAWPRYSLAFLPLTHRLGPKSPSPPFQLPVWASLRANESAPNAW